jgi:hypothetical protein
MDIDNFRLIFCHIIAISSEVLEKATLGVATSGKKRDELNSTYVSLRNR